MYGTVRTVVWELGAGDGLWLPDRDELAGSHRLHFHTEIAMNEPESTTVKTENTGPNGPGAAWTISPHPWWGRCPDCGALAVFRETEPGRVSGACSAPSSRRCWWTT